MNLSEYASHDAIGLAKRVSDREVTPAELAELARSAIEAVNPAINAVIEHWPASDSGGNPEHCTGPLAGVPFLIKDLAVAMSGKRLELGSRLSGDVVAPADSWLMSRFRAAGLVTIGRTTTPEMAFSTTTESTLQGATRNPWQPDSSAGGSSGGAAAAVAAGVVPLAHATDAAGSIRVPASYNGLFGLKPTRGRSSNGPALDEVFAGFGVQLGVSWSVRDSAALLDAIQGQAIGEPYLTAAPEYSFLSQVEREPGNLRIGMMTDPWSADRTDPAIAAAVESTARFLEELGHTVFEVRPSLGVSWDAFVQMNATIWTATLVGWIEGLAAATGRPIDETTLEPATLACYRYGKEEKASAFAAALAMRNVVTRAVGHWFEDFDVLLTPTLPQMPPRIGEYGEGAESMNGLEWTQRVFRHSPLTPPFNVAGVPAMSVPLASHPETGLPIGMQFAGAFAREDKLLRLAGQLERARPWINRRPVVWAGRQE
ncbi:amidase [Burkholderia cepacia]|uniref:Amidase n=1 Tax=Burkholderia cepacia TaxID=292 RepID=A0AAX2R9J7_BURCE|nr:amidase [Burkholderia cepacia]OUE42790.1 amidase [Burkholderia territorii]EMD9436329.1 amidase [Burkholderia cepacia]KVF23356.1 6-aminohexanoate hydrolase [Burkholderia cepacia]KWH55534.1 6-aminohexanoate hydrolase [Burkholderia cepacia]NTX19423.1 amidase [Burkholderia cepacia]